MRWVFLTLALLWTLPIAAQSLGDVAREQRGDPDRPRAKRVITNGDISSFSDDQSAKPTVTAKQPTNPATRNQQPESDRALSRRLNELNQRVQGLQTELNDLERQRTSLRNIYGDPNRIQRNEEIRHLGEQIDGKTAELSAARNELRDAMERANNTTVLK